MQGEAAKGFPQVALKILASALLVLYFLAAWGSGLDRLSIVSPSLERLVPGPLRAQADRSAAAIALARGDSQSALRYATQAVRTTGSSERRPSASRIDRGNESATPKVARISVSARPPQRSFST